VRRFSPAAQAPTATVDRKTALNRLMASILKKSLTPRASTLCISHPCSDQKLAAIMPGSHFHGRCGIHRGFRCDGWPDIYVTNSAIGSKNHLTANITMDPSPMLPNRWVLPTSISPVRRPPWARLGDFDNDGYDDLLSHQVGSAGLFHNDQGHGFTRATEQAGLPPWINAKHRRLVSTTTAIGKLDLFVGGLLSPKASTYGICPIRAVMPESFEYAKNGGRKFFFTILARVILKNQRKVGIDTIAVRWLRLLLDLRGTGHPDLFIANDYGVSELYLHDGNTSRGRRRNRHRFAPKSGMNASFGDIFNQGKIRYLCVEYL